MRAFASPVVLVALLTAAAAQTAGGATQEKAMTGTDTVLDTLRDGHPRLLLTEQRLAELKRRAKTDPALRKIVAEVIARADDLLDEPVLEYKLRGPRLLHVSRRLVRRTYALGLAWRWTGEANYRDKLVDNLLAVCAFDDWHPSHFLDTAEMAHGVAIGYDWLYDDLDDATRATIRAAIVRHGLETGLASYEGARYGWWTESTHNWNQVCNGGMIVGALAVAEDEAEVTQRMIALAVQSMPKALRQYGPDGAWGEGPGYWGYATRYTVYALAALETALGKDFGLSELPGLSKAGDFPLYCAGPTGYYFNYADSGDFSRHGPRPSLLWLGRRYGRPAYIAGEMRMAAARGGEARHVIWYPDDPSPEAPERSLDKLFGGEVEVALLRSAWGDPNALWVAVKAGDNQVNHGHLDLGSFELDALGVRWARDLGSDDYNLPGYWQRNPGGQRWTYYRMRSISHSVPLLNGADQDPLAKARMIAFHSGDDRGHAVIDLTEAYKPAATKVERGVAMVADRTAVLVQDEFDLRESTDITWAMTTDATIEVRGDGRALLTLKGKRLEARLLAPAGATFRVESAEQQPPEKTNEGVSRLRGHLPDQSGAVRVAVLLAPADAMDAAAEPVKLVPLSDWQGRRE
ncbi:MAG: heparinase II/III domain-containing protein [Planctomycetota bacterium]